ncbi:hypothetical protein HDV00_002329 [Rhizophlyctis rosea]|nr:hypothetical protein HDV00_002329 [Rhizophlyctis rosea]
MASLKNTPLPPGIYVPSPTFFHENEDLDLPSLHSHLSFLSNTGLAGIIIHGSTGEAVHLTRTERATVISSAAQHLRTTDPSLILIAGCGADGIRPTLEYIQDAAQSGAQYALVLPPSYFRSTISPAGILAWFTKVADESPLPIIIYNFPGVSQGTDIDVETLVTLAKHPNIVGIKGTDGNIAKVGFLAPRIDPKTFTILAGSADFFLPALSVGAKGCVPGLGNICPTAHVKLQKLFEEGKTEEALKIQHALVKPDDAVNRWHGIPGMKGLLQHLNGYGGGNVRLPLLKVGEDKVQKVLEGTLEAWELEKSLRA